MTASFPMYSRPEMDNAHNEYWSLIQKHLTASGIDSPDKLSIPTAVDQDLYPLWEDPNLLITQTCGMPYRNTLHGKVQLVGAPDFRLEGCPAGYYRSAVIVRAEDKDKALSDFKDAVFAHNSDDSQSGYGSVYLLTKAHGFWFKNRIATGSHRESTLAIVEGRADIAAIDETTWRITQTYDTHTDKLAIIDWTAPTPGTPYITAMGNDAATILEAMNAALIELSDESRKQLGIHAVVKLSAEDYLSVENPPS